MAKINHTTSSVTIAGMACHRPKSEVSLRLFCFPYAGGGASIFRAWPNSLPAPVEVCPIQLPGRENRLLEPPFSRMPPLVRASAQALRPYLDKPFAFFGHSMGALLSFELARYLRRNYDRQPVYLVASGRIAPQIRDPDPPIHALPEAEFMEELRRFNGTPKAVLEHTELMEMFLPTLRADFAVCETYAYVSEPPLDCPISAFGGLQDQDVSRADLEAWQDQTSASFLLRMFSGDHFFLHTEQQLLLHVLSQELCLLLSEGY